MGTGRAAARPLGRPWQAGWRGRPVALLGAGLVLLLSSGAGIPATAAPGRSAVRAGATFTVGVLNDVDSLNPFSGDVAESNEIRQIMYDTLTRPSARDFAATPGLATRWKTSKDGLAWTYTLRSGVKWSDGAPLTAKDVVYTLNRVLTGVYEQARYGSDVAGITSVTAPDNTTVVIRTRTPNPGLLHLAVPVLPAHIWSKIGDLQTKSYDNEAGAVGSGPFVLAERQSGQFVRLTANPNYWGAAPKIRELVYRVYPTADALAQALRQGEVDFADQLDSKTWTSLKGAPGVKTRAATHPGFDELAFNTGAALANGTAIGDGNPALKDRRVRRALDHAIDRPTLVKRALNGNGAPGSTVIPPIYAGLHQQPAKPRSFDLARAGRLLDEAGYRKGAAGKRTAPDGQPLALRLFARAESPSSQVSARLIRGWFGQLGIPVTLTVISEDVLAERIAQGRYDLFQWGWVVEPDPSYQLSTFTCAQRSYREGGQIYAGQSDSFYCNPAYDRLQIEQSRQVDPAQRAGTVRKLQQILYDDVPYAVLYTYDNLQAYSTRFTGFVAQPPPDGALLFQDGPWSYLSLAPIAATATRGGSEDGEGVAGTLPVMGAVAGALLLGGALLLRRNRRRRRSGAGATDVD